MKSSGPDRPNEQGPSRYHYRPFLRLQATAVLLLILHFVSPTLALRREAYREIHTDDAVILEAYPVDQEHSTGRDIDHRRDPLMSNSGSGPQGTDDLSTVRTSRTKRQNSWSMVSGPCVTARGTLGKCTSFRLCYPYIKMPNFQYWDSWMVGMYDTCTYISIDHKQMFGVCCDHPSFVGESHKEEGIRPPPAMVMPPNWPPPLPTHPPDHTIPPIPTHPPQKPPSTQPTKPTPPQKPTIPPWPPFQHQNFTTTTPHNKPITTTTTTTTTTTPSYVDGEGGSYDYQCGLKNGPQDQERIVGGQNADPGEWPWIVAIFNSGRHFCGGSLIDDTHVLTAAHCVAHMSSWDVARLTVNLGDYNIKSKTDVKHMERKIKRVVRHKGFDQRTLYNDIALLTLDKPVKFDKQVHPICLPTSRSMYAGHTATVIGWGSLKESGPQPAILQKVNVPVWTNQECKFKYGAAAPGGIVDHFLCAGKAARDSCSGDSGGPLMLNDGKWTQVGIVSWGIGCGKGQYPGVYTRVTSFMNWITRNLKT
ncbi:transmembrane protease serine 9-like [Rhopalosiphum maidis]|uniref:transmembrane protease serine 9-like n=1 Tax=Rhopalosiphum maidis TaxID=43146 RepID=UPI000EFE4A5C|nr:transmembrane protease serine 9-like [Rhopalosiphum maidis]